MVHRERIRDLNDQPAQPGRYVLYWMQASQRADWNHALEYAIEQANERHVPVLAAFGLMDDYPEANERHYAFMLEGLAETAEALARRGVQLVVRRARPDKLAVELAGEALMVVADRGYLRHQRQWRDLVGRCAPCRAVEVESDVVVPAEAASDKEEYAARTIRPKLQRQWARYLVPHKPRRPRRDSLGLRLGGEDLRDADGLLASLRIDRSVGRVMHYVGGASRARELLRQFIADKLPCYGEQRNDPSQDLQSHLSPYLHFGQISPVEIGLAVQGAGGAPVTAREAFLEQLIVRRELCVNFVFYNSRYDSFDGLPAWARTTLKARARDRRPYLYSPEDLAASRTHDPYWNAAMTEMRLTGTMHGYMRMYWGKKIIEWTRGPRQAFRTMLALNNRYFLDGRDPCSFANVAWCFGQHDRPWGQRPIFGTVRYMNAAGLERKFHIDVYVRQIEALAAEADGRRG